MPRKPRKSSRRASTDAILQAYASNLPRHLIGVAHATLRPLARACEEAGYAAPSPAALQTLLHLARRGTRITDLARYTGITQQAVGQLVSQLERRGMLARAADPSDRRTHALRLTARGSSLARLAAQAARRSERRLNGLLGPRAFADLRHACLQLFDARVVASSGSAPLEAASAAALPLALMGLATHCERVLMELTRARGYPDLKMSFGQVLTHLSPHGSLVRDLARINDVSKQAISHVVLELEAIGFVERRRHGGDRRSTLIFLTPAGLELIRASIANIAVLEADFARVLGRARLARFAATLGSLAGTLQQSTTGISAALLDLLERLYREHGGSPAPQLFVQAAGTARLSEPALRILAGLVIRPDVISQRRT